MKTTETEKRFSAAGGSTAIDRNCIPPTVSTEAAANLKAFYEQLSHKPEIVEPPSVAEWEQLNRDAEAAIESDVAETVRALGVNVTEGRLGDVPVLRVTAPGKQQTGPTLLYAHGGAYVFNSARTTLVLPALIAMATGGEVISVDYTLAPRGTWLTTPDQIISVYNALLSEGLTPPSIGFMGDSAGGALVASSILKLRDNKRPIPGALCLVSPWSDISTTGDTTATLQAFDPFLRLPELSFAAQAYAPENEHKNPYVSPLYGDYSKQFPPTLIQCGTRDLLLSVCVRHYQAILAGGHEAVIDLYEGMPHVFPSVLPPSTPESQIAVERAAAFFKHQLDY